MQSLQGTRPHYPPLFLWDVYITPASLICNSGIQEASWAFHGRIILQVKKCLRERESKASKASVLLHSSAGQDMFAEWMTRDFQRLCFMANLQKGDTILVALSYALRTASNVIYKLLAFHLIAGKPSRMIEKNGVCYQDWNNVRLCRNGSSKSSSTSKETCASNTYSFLQILRQRMFNKCRTCCSLSTEAPDLTADILDYECQPRRWRHNCITYA